MKIPIPNTEQNRDDPFYRYQRDKIQTVKKGQFYAFTNLEIIAKQIHTEIGKLILYMSKVMGQPVTMNKKTNEIMIKSLSLDPEEVLEAYITKYIICKKCNLPELDEQASCKACGLPFSTQSLTAHR